MSSADAVAGVLWIGATLYAVFGGADFGAGFWSLTAGQDERGERARALVDWAISDARRADDPDLESYFATRAQIAALVAGAIALAAIFVYRADARFIYDGLTSEGLPLVIASGVFGLGVLALLFRGQRRGTRALAVGAVVAVIWGWGVAQYPYLLPQRLTIKEGAGAGGTLTAVLIVFGVAVVVVLP